MKTPNRRSALAILGAASSTLFAPAVVRAATKRKVAMPLLFPAGGDVGWDYEHIRGAKMALAAHGNDVEIDFFHEIAEWGNGDKEFFQQLVADGYEMIFTTSAGYMKSTIEVAHEAPNVLFENCAGYIRSKNVSTYNARWYEGRAVQGFLAATMSKNNRVGYLGAYPIPQVVRGINAAYLGAKAVNPDIEFDITWLNTWYDYDAETKTANMLLDNGADVLMQHTVSTAAVEVAQKRGYYAFGQGSDMKKYAPDAILTSMQNNWGPYYTRRIGDFLNGTWKSEDTWGGLGAEMIALSDLLDTMPNRTHLQAKDLMERISSGQHQAFGGPVRRQNGAGWLAPGETASDSDLLTMDFYVDGIKSVYPNIA